ncbi:MAG: molecular chaperone HscC [Lachnospiraceae bacterium]|nr:molecular chaperone HscC [Lachnospiraceae bacterium]
MIVGIDLGTTNSLVAIFRGEKAEIIPNRLGEKLTPSVVSFGEDGTVYVGKTAKERSILYPDRTVSLFKRYMGSSKEYEIGYDVFTPSDIASILLRTLKEDAEEYLGEKITDAIISVPAYFNDEQRKATKLAGYLAGLNVERIISEPTAAAVAYGIENKEINTRFLVFDLGGGTFDVSILEKYEHIMEVRAVAGDNHIGGEDFTDTLIKMFIKENGLDINNIDRKTYAYIRKQAENAKCNLGTEKEIKITCNIDEEYYESVFSIDEYEAECKSLLERIRKPIERTLRDAKLKIADIDEIILVGGGTRLSIVRKYVSRLFGRIPNCELDAEEVVAMGVSISAAMQENNKEIKEVILTDVCAFSLGTEIVTIKNNSVEQGHFLPIIDRNTVIPVSKNQTLYTANDNQETIRIRILQGESRHAKNNMLIGEIVTKVPKNEAGKESIDVTYTYDINAVLEVEIKVNSTKEKTRVVFKGNSLCYSQEEIEKRLEELSYLKISPRDEEKNKHILFRAERLYEELLGDDRIKIERYISDLEDALDMKDKLLIERKREELKNFMTLIEEENDIFLYS